jgi:hypothetical protein
VVGQQVSWEDVAEYDDPNDEWNDLIRSGLDAVMGAIEAGRQEKYPRIGERAVIADIVDRARELLSEQSGVSLRRWPGRDFEEIFTSRTNVTMWLDAQFEVDPKEPFGPVGVRDDKGRMCLAIRVRFKLGGHVRKSSELAAWFQGLLDQGSFMVDGVGELRPDASKWFTWSEPYVGSEDEVAERLADVGHAVFGALRDSFEREGLELVREDEEGA